MDMLGPDEQDMANAWATRFGSVGSVLGYFLSEMDLTKAVPVVGENVDQVTVLSLFAIVILTSTHLSLVFCIREARLLDTPSHAHHGLHQSLREIIWKLYHCGRTLPQPIWDLFVIQFFSWLAWFPVLFYCAAWVAEVYARAHGASSQAATLSNELGEESRRTGSLAMLCYSCTGLVAAVVLPWLVYDPKHTASASAHGRYERATLWSAEHHDHGDGVAATATHEDTHSKDNSAHDNEADVSSASRAGQPLSGTSETPRQSFSLSQWRTRVWTWLRRGPTLAEVWLISQILFVATMLGFTCPVSSYNSVWGAITLVGVLGISWAITLWVPYALLGILLFTTDAHGQDSDMPLAALGPTTRVEGASVPHASPRTSAPASSVRSEAGAVMGLHNWSIVLPQLAVSALSSIGMLSLGNGRAAHAQYLFCRPWSGMPTRPARWTARASSSV